MLFNILESFRKNLKEALKRYRQTEHCKEQQKKYRLSKKGIIKRKKNAKILWQNIKLARKIKN